MDFREKIQAIEQLLPNDKRIKSRTVLACGIYYHLKLKVPFRKIPTSEIYNWSSYRHWMQRLQKLNLLNQIKRIIEGD